jgi:hypothetical protein
MSQGIVTALFKDRNFLQALSVALLACEFGSEVSGDKFMRQCGTNHTSTEHENVHIVVLDSLMSRIRIVTETGTNARQFVGGHRRADAAAADQHTAVSVAIEENLADSLGIIGVIDRLRAVCADVHNLMAKPAYICGNVLF